MSYKVVGTLRELVAVQRVAPELNLFEYEQVIEGRSFSRWYAKNRKLVGALVMPAVSLAFALFNVTPFFLSGVLLPALPLAIPAGGGGTFFDGHGVILLHMLIVGFLTLVVSTFLKFTGRGDIVPLVMFVGGGVILYETMQLFNDIYNGVKVFFNM